MAGFSRALQQAARRRRLAEGGIAWVLEHDYRTGALHAAEALARASTATYVNSSGMLIPASSDVARFTHDPATLAARGLMIEGARTNLAAQSEALDTTWAGYNATASADTATAPDGNATADTLVGAAGSNPQARYISTSFTAAMVYSVSQFQLEGTTAFGHLTSGGGSTTHFIHSTANLNTGAVTQSGAGGNGTRTGGGIVGHGAGWHRHWLAGSFSSGAGDFNYVALAASGTPSIGNYGLPANFDGAGHDIRCWGYQFELGAFPSSYIPTAGSSATRAAETCIDTTMAWWNAGAGTFFVEARIDHPSGARQVIWQADGNTADERFAIYATSGNAVYFEVVDGGVEQASLNLGPFTPGTAFKVAAAFAANDIAAIMTGGTLQTDTGATLPTIDRSRVGHDIAGNHLFGTLAAKKFAGSRLADATLEALV